MRSRMLGVLRNRFMPKNHGPRSALLARPRPSSRSTSGTFSPLVGMAAAVTAAATANLSLFRVDMAEEGEDEGFLAGEHVDGLPTYRMEDIAKHTTLEGGYWVAFRGGVYDVTDFVEMHPGGNKIFLGIGSHVDPFWNVFQQHFQPHVQHILEDNYRIGNLHPDDQISQEELDANDPFANEPTDRSPLLKQITKRPYTAECPNEILLDDFITPNEVHYVRCHSAVPLVDVDNWKLSLSGAKGSKLELSYEDLKSKFPRHEIMMTLQCAGNRAAGYRYIKGQPHIVGTFFDGGISNSMWAGVRLRDLLAAVGVDDNGSGYNWIKCTALDGEESDPYCACMTMQKALDRFGDVIVAYEMNGEPVPRDHGFPCRVLIPGWAGLNNVKWLTAISVHKEKPDEFMADIGSKKSEPVRALPVQSLIISPHGHDTQLESDDDEVYVEGYAYSGGGNKIIKVDVTIDNGETWVRADLEQSNQQEGRHWTWTHWNASVPIKDGRYGDLKLQCKAVDSNFQTQPREYCETWMEQGVCNNRWHYITVNRPPPEEVVA